MRKNNEISVKQTRVSISFGAHRTMEMYLFIIGFYVWHFMLSPH